MVGYMRGKAGGKQMIEKCRMIEFPQKGDDRGHLVIVEGNQDIPFEIKRVFYIYGSDKDVIRGKHANYNTEFVLINVAGTSKVKVDDGTEQKIFSLDRPHTGIFLPRMVWKDMYDFSEDSVLLVLASEHYDETEYIRSYSEYLEIMKQKNATV
jgi:dTDP-4-dehydrorhamnose 3,5-epimerase-like enzyme